MTELENYIQSCFGGKNDDVKMVSSFFRNESVKKGDFFLRKGRYSERFGFVKSGLLREFLHIDDKEVTKWISSQGGFVMDLASFTFRQPARWNIQALTDCELHVIERPDYIKLIDVIPGWIELEKLFITKCFTVLENRVLQHLSLSAEERYLRLFESNKELFNLVPLQYLASMLGMTPETFSRIRKKITEQTS